MATWRRLCLGLCAVAWFGQSASGPRTPKPTTPPLRGNWMSGAVSPPVVGSKPTSSPKRSMPRATSPRRLPRDVRTTLTRVDGRRITLRVVMTLDAGGRRFDTAPQTIDHGYFGETADQAARVRDLGNASRRRSTAAKSRCRLAKRRSRSGKQKTVNKFFETGALAPYLLRRETHFTDDSNPAANHEETSEVIAIDKPYRVQSEIRPVSFERVVQKDATARRLPSM